MAEKISMMSETPLVKYMTDDQEREREKDIGLKDFNILMKL
jgi:hypothetical protein